MKMKVLSQKRIKRKAKVKAQEIKFKAGEIKKQWKQ